MGTPWTGCWFKKNLFNYKHNEEQTNKHPPRTPPPSSPTLPKLPLPRTLMKLKSFRLLLWLSPFCLAAEEDEEEEVVEEEEEEECWGPCWSSDSASCRRSNSAKSVGVIGKADQTSAKTGRLTFLFFPVSIQLNYTEIRAVWKHYTFVTDCFSINFEKNKTKHDNILC